MTTLLTCMGEILIDFLPIETDGTTTGFTMHPGGGPFNVAVGTARLGQPTAFASKIGSDFFGRHLDQYLRSHDIATDFLSVTDRALTTLAFVAQEDGEPAFTFYGEGTADTLLTLDDVPAALFEQTAILHFGGISLLRGSTPETVLATVERIKGQALLSFDPNMRPALIHDEPSYRVILERGFDATDLLKVSTADLAWLDPERKDEVVARDLLAHGPALVVLTQGGDGVVALRQQPSGAIERWRVPSFVVDVVDTVGAGDAFSGGFLASLAERDVRQRDALLALPGDELVASVRFAAATAAIACSRPGADPPRREEVVAFLDQAD